MHAIFSSETSAELYLDASCQTPNIVIFSVSSSDQGHVFMIFLIFMYPINIYIIFYTYIYYQLQLGVVQNTECVTLICKEISNT
jgi:hypothetical protein